MSRPFTPTYGVDAIILVANAIPLTLNLVFVTAPDRWLIALPALAVGYSLGRVVATFFRSLETP